MAFARTRRPNPLRLIRRKDDDPAILTDRASQIEFERLTQRLVDIAIEVTDIISGDADLEEDRLELEHDDGI